jgi:outer membrane protein assembly factor BamA
MYRGPGTGDELVIWPAATRRVWLLGGSVGLDTRDNQYYPSRGFYGRIRGLYNDAIDYPSFAEWVGDVRAFVPLPWEHVLAMWAWGRWVSGPGPIEDYLYIGGPENLRGYPFFHFEGEHGYLLSVEYRAPLFRMPISPQGELLGFGLHAFADAGDTWFDGATSSRANRDIGLGAHLLIGTYQLRFEVAHTETGDTRFQFMDRFNF